VPTPSHPTTEQWLQESREVVSVLYPQARWASLVVNLGDGVPSAVLVVIPAASDETEVGAGLAQTETGVLPPPAPRPHASSS
jgi:hypothetical protein